MNPVTLRLTLAVKYLPNGTPVPNLRALLNDIATRAAGDGLMTGDTPAEVETWAASVDEIQPDEYPAPSLSVLDLLSRALEYVESYGTISDTEASHRDREDLAHSIHNALHTAALAEGETLSPGEVAQVNAQLLAALELIADYSERPAHTTHADFGRVARAAIAAARL